MLYINMQIFACRLKMHIISIKGGSGFSLDSI